MHFICVNKDLKQNQKMNKHAYLNCRHYVNTNCKEFIKLQERVEAASHVKKAHFPQLRDRTTTQMWNDRQCQNQHVTFASNSASLFL